MKLRLIILMFFSLCSYSTSGHAQKWSVQGIRFLKRYSRTEPPKLSASKTTPQVTYLIVAVCCAVLLSACSVKYGPRIPGFQPGYEDQRLGEATYQIRIGEAWPKDWPDLEKFAMYRAAELTKQQGKQFFKILSATTQISSHAISSPSQTYVSGTAYRTGNVVNYSGTATTVPGTTSNIEGGWYYLDFRVLDVAEAGAVDANQVEADLKYFIASRR